MSENVSRRIDTQPLPDFEIYDFSHPIDETISQQMVTEVINSRTAHYNLVLEYLDVDATDADQNFAYYSKSDSHEDWWREGINRTQAAHAVAMARKQGLNDTDIRSYAQGKLDAIGDWRTAVSDVHAALVVERLTYLRDNAPERSELKSRLSKILDKAGIRRD